MNPTASPRYFPYREHRNMAEVMREEAGWAMAFQRVCPRCGAAPGKLCTLAGGRPYNGGIHSARRVG
jgi:hypothetical protein